ncbi:hypothetical protein ETC03_12315 [Geobacillus sp. MMMUD3]|nr:hypothetical protein [Geobacillus sp. MMMUD3]
MNDKIRWFKAFYRLDRFTNPNEPYLPSATDISYDDLLWLVEQAEIVERLRNENKKLTRIAIEADEGCEYWKDKYKQAQAKAERYEKALREIANEQEVGEGDFNASDIANNLIATAKEALGW